MQLTTKYTRSRSRWLAALRISPLLAAVFLCAQILATAHSAAHSDNYHVHDGVPCIIAAASKQNDAMDLAAAGPKIDVISHTYTFIPNLVHAPAHTAISIRSIRAPPALS